MIVFNLSCDSGHRFEGWFGSSSDFASQQDRGLIECPECGSSQVAKAPTAPAVPAKGNTRQEVAPVRAETAASDRQPVASREMPPEVTKALQALAKAQAKALEKSTWVGDSFAEKSRAMHYGEQDATPIHGEATSEEAQDLVDEGIAVAPLPFPIAPPEELN